MRTERQTQLTGYQEYQARHLHWSWGRKLLLATQIASSLFVGTTLGSLIVYRESWARLLRPGRIECLSEVPTGPKTDAVLIPGSSVVRTATGEMVPDSLLGLRLRAAAKFLISHPDLPVVLLEGSKTEAEVASRYLQQVYHDLSDGQTLPQEKIILDWNSINTATNMQNAAEILRQRGLRNATILTNRSQARRATQLACNNGLAASYVTAEDILDAGGIRRQSGLGEGSTTIIFEKGETWLTAIDPLGNLPTAWIRVFGRTKPSD